MNRNDLLWESVPTWLDEIAMELEEVEFWYIEEDIKQDIEADPLVIRGFCMACLMQNQIPSNVLGRIKERGITDLDAYLGAIARKAGIETREEIPCNVDIEKIQYAWNPIIPYWDAIFDEPIKEHWWKKTLRDAGMEYRQIDDVENWMEERRASPSIKRKTATKIKRG